MSVKFLIAFLALCWTPLSTAFLNEINERLYPKPPSIEHADSIVNEELLLHLSVEDKKNEGSFAIRGLAVTLNKDDLPLSQSHHLNKQVIGTSSGLHSVSVTTPGSWVGRNGLEHANIGTADWEVVWGNDGRGKLILGLDLLDPAVRNHVQLNAGKIYVSFSVWETEALEDFQERKEKALAVRAAHLAERDSQLGKMQETSNFFAKAVHYRNAAAAVEAYQLYPDYGFVPNTDEIMSLGNWQVSKKGSLWTKSTAFLTERCVGLGTASLQET